MKTLFRSALALFFVGTTLAASDASAECPSFDVVRDGTYDVRDFACVLDAMLSFIAAPAANAKLPSCLGGFAVRADLNCDRQVDVADVQLIAHFLANRFTLPLVLDADENACVDTCQ
jgi:hypothetical protein